MSTAIASPSPDCNDDGASHHQADSVLRLVANPWGFDWRILALGVDTLECGYHVVPLQASVATLSALEALRQRAQAEHQPVPWEDDLLPGMLYPGAGARSHTYRYHLATPIAQVYIRGTPTLDGTPSVLVGFSSEALWCQGGALPLGERIRVWLAARGFATQQVQPSRCDVAVDVHMPGGITREVIEAHLVTRAKARDARTDWDRFKGYALGSRQSPIYARIYDKTREIAEQSHKGWQSDIWGERLTADVIRIEFQLNRSFLRDLEPSLDTVADLMPRLPGLWRYLTTDWCSLRVPESKRAARRVVLPGWERITEAGINRLGGSGSLVPVVRAHGLAGDAEHLRRSGLSWATSAMALHEDKTPTDALLQALRDVITSLPQEDVPGRVRAKQIKRGRDPGPLGPLPRFDDLGPYLRPEAQS